MEIIFKLGDKFPTNHPKYKSDWLNYQVIDIGDSFNGREELKTHGCISLPNIIYDKNDPDLKKFVSPVDENGNIHVGENSPFRRRNYIVNIDKMLQTNKITQSEYDNVLRKDIGYKIVLSDNNLNSVIEKHTELPEAAVK